MTDAGYDWRPSATPVTLSRRAEALAASRSFFAARGLQEVETPILVSHPVSDPQLANVRCELAVRHGTQFWLQTSPEYHMKRLLAAGSPDIWQLCKVFRDGELGPRHLAEFTLVEWYRHEVAYDDFIAEACDFIGTVAASVGRAVPPPSRRSYRDVLRVATGIDPLDASVADMRRCAARFAGTSPELAVALGDDRTGWLDLLMVTAVEPTLRGEGLVIIDRYPAAQAALARLDTADRRVAERFEIYLDGIELANGYHELADADEQRLRFEMDRRRRRESGLADAPADPALLAALEAGLPDCCGIALGFDRLLMACLGLADIRETVSFATPADR